MQQLTRLLPGPGRIPRPSAWMSTASSRGRGQGAELQPRRCCLLPGALGSSELSVLTVQ